jgi:hypothetical protein
MPSSLLTVIQNITSGIKIHIENEPSTKFDLNIFNLVAWAFSSCIQAWFHLRPVISVDVDFYQVGML